MSISLISDLQKSPRFAMGFHAVSAISAIFAISAGKMVG